MSKANARNDNKISPDLDTPTDMSPEAVNKISAAVNVLLADAFALYLKTKNFHWHVSGPHFRDYHLLLDDQATEIFAMTDPIAERVRKIGGTTLRSIGHIARLQRLQDGLVLRNGAVDEPPGERGATVLAARALSEGTERYDAIQLVEASERLGAALHAEANWDGSLGQSERAGFGARNVAGMFDDLRVRLQADGERRRLFRESLSRGKTRSVPGSADGGSQPPTREATAAKEVRSVVSGL